MRNVVSGQQVFMRFIKLSPLDTADIDEQVGYEAQQHIPFNLNDIVYSYQVLTNSEDGREVLLVAIKKDVLDNLNGQIEGAGLKTRGVDCSITSLYNAFRASYPEENEPVMILDIGAKTTDIIFSENGQFFTRSVTAAGSYITNNIAREFNMGFRDAERFKIESGVVSLGSGFTDNLSESEASLVSVIRNAMGRLSSEVQRTINHYRGQYGGSSPVKAYICGGGARLTYAAEFLQSALNIPVEYLNPLAAFSIGSKIDQEALGLDALCLGPIAGAAVTGAKVGVFNIDLVPTSVGKERTEMKMIPKVVAAGLIALAGAGVFAFAANKSATEAENMLSKAKPLMEKTENIESQLKSAKSKYDKSMKELLLLKDVFAMRTAYSDILQQISQYSASVDYWITDFSPLINYEVENSTLTESNDVKGVHLIDMGKSLGGSRATARNNAPEQVDPRKRKLDPVVTAICVTGYTIKNTTKKEGDSGIEHRVAINNLVGKLSESNSESLFSYQLAEVAKDQNRYFRFVDSKNAKGRVQVPDYVENSR